MTTTSTRVALVTGGARGIGLAVARGFLARGHAVALLDIDAATLAATEAALDEPARVLAIVGDVSSAPDVARAMAAVAARFGRLDALVNNAGIAVFKPTLQTTHEEFSRVLAVNLHGAFLCTQAAAPLMQQGGGGAVVNIASISGLRASTLRVAYGTSKAGLIHLTKQHAVELGTVGIRVNCVAPGFCDAPMLHELLNGDTRAEEASRRRIPLGRFGDPAEIAHAVAFLCSDLARYMTGSVIPVDGGWLANGGA